MDIYIPYFYIIQNKHTSIYYVGSKYGKDANPETFMKENGYITSSKIIKEIIQDSGIDTFIVRKLKTFKNANDAYTYESRFLKKVDAKNNPKFYNGHNNNFSVIYDPCWRKIPDKNGLTSYQKGARKSAINMMSSIVDGKNVYQISYEKALKRNPDLNEIRSKKSTQSKLVVDEKTGFTIYQIIGQKISGENNPSKKPENAKKISDGRKKEIAENKEKWLERQRKHNNKLSTEKDENGLTARDKHSLWMKQNNPTRESIWINNGKTNLRIKKGESIPDGYSLGRIKKNQ